LGSGFTARTRRVTNRGRCAQPGRGTGGLRGSSGRIIAAPRRCPRHWCFNSNWYYGGKTPGSTFGYVDRGLPSGIVETAKTQRRRVVKCLGVLENPTCSHPDRHGKIGASRDNWRSRVANGGDSALDLECTRIEPSSGEWVAPRVVSRGDISPIASRDIIAVDNFAVQWGRRLMNGALAKFRERADRKNLFGMAGDKGAILRRGGLCIRSRAAKNPK